MTENLVTLTEPSSPSAEAYRRLRINLMSACRDAPLRSVLVVAAGPNENKATVVANLAVAFARIGKQVILADCDLRRPAQHAIFAASNEAGVTTAVEAPDGVLPLRATEVPGLRLLPSGPQVEAPSDLLASDAMARLVDRLRAEAEIVLFDAPPVTLAADAAELATRVDGVLLIVVAGSTKREDAQRARDLIEQVGGCVLGATLMDVAADAELRRYLAVR